MSKIAREVAGIYLLYLRKSRADNPDESVEEVLAKHEAILQEFAERELGRRIPEDCIYREVVSAESIEGRIEIQKMLQRMESPNVKGVIVIDPQRLSRGDLLDCGTLINNLRYSRTLVVTPVMTYDLENKMERRFFQDELMRGRDYLEYVKEVLRRGRTSAVKNRGCFIGSVPPYGYDKVKIGKDCTLVPNGEADLVRMMFDMYVNEWKTPFEIAKELDRLGTTARSGRKWDKGTIRKILQNYHYIGKVYYMRRPVQTTIKNGEKVTTRSEQHDDMIMVEGKHQAIIDAETFNKAQERFSSHPKVKKSTELKNQYAGVIYCSECGRALKLKLRRNGTQTYVCPAYCGKAVDGAKFTETIIQALEFAELPKLEAKWKNGDGTSLEIKANLIKTLEKQMEEYRSQEETQYELLETRKYTQELFDKRNAILREKMYHCQAQLKEVRNSMPNAVDYNERILTLTEAINMLKSKKSTPLQMNRLLKSIVERIDYHSSKDQPTGTNDFELKIKLRL